MSIAEAAMRLDCSRHVVKTLLDTGRLEYRGRDGASARVELPDGTTVDLLRALPVKATGSRRRPPPGLTPSWTRPAEARDVLCTSMARLHLLVREGLLEGSWDGTELVGVNLEGTASIAEIADRFFTDPPRCRAPEDFERYRRLSAFLRRTAAPRQPASIVSDGVDYLLENGTKPTAAALCALVGAAAGMTHAMFHKETERRGLVGKGFRTSKFGHRRGVDEEPAVLARVAPCIRTMPGTYLDPDIGGTAERLPAPYWSRLNRIRNQALLDAATVVTLWLHREGMKDYQIKQMLLGISDVDEVAVGRDMSDPRTVAECLLETLGEHWARGEDVGYARLNAVIRYRWMGGHYQEFLEKTALRRDCAEFDLLRPVEPVGRLALYGKIDRERTRLSKSYTDHRQERIAKILDRPEELQLVGSIRYEEQESIRRGIDDFIDGFMAEGGTLTKAVGFTIQYGTRSINGGFVEIEQRMHLELWSWALLLEEMADRRDGEELIRGIRGIRSSTPTTGRDMYVARFVGMSPATQGGTVQLPVIVEACKGLLIEQSTNLNARQMARQKEAVDRLGFDLAAWRHAKSLPGFPRAKARIARAAAQALDFVLLPHREFSLGLLFADTAREIILDAGCRWHEASQAQIDGEWKDTYIEALGQTIWTFQAIPKKRDRPSDVLITDRTFGLLMDLAERTVQLWHPGSGIPRTRGNPDHVSKGIPPARRIFHCGNGPMMHDMMSLLLRLQYLGWFGLKGQDLRHLWKHMAEKGNVSKKDRMHVMSQRSEDVHDDYGRATKNELRAAEIDHKAFMISRATSREAALKRARPPGVMELEKESRRQAALLDHHRREGDLAAAEVATREMERLCVEILRIRAAADGSDEVIDVSAI